MARRVAREEGLLIGGSGGTGGAPPRSSVAQRAAGPTTSSSCSSPTPAAATCRGSSTTTGWPTSASCASATSASAPCSTPRSESLPPLVYVNPERHGARGDRRHARPRRLAAPGVQERAAVRGRRGVGRGRRARADGRRLPRPGRARHAGREGDGPEAADDRRRPAARRWPCEMLDQAPALLVLVGRPSARRAHPHRRADVPLAGGGPDG